MSNVDTVTAAYQAFASGDIAGVLDVLADDVEWSAPLTLPQGGHFTGKAGVGEFFQGIGAKWANLSLELRGLAALTDDIVVGVVTGSGELQSGGNGSYGAAHVFTLANGKVTHFQEYVDLDAPLA